MKTIIAILATLLISTQALLAYESELNTLKLYDITKEADTYIAVHKEGETFFFDLCEIETDDCSSLASLDEYWLKSYTVNRRAYLAASGVFAALVAFGVGMGIKGEIDIISQASGVLVPSAGAAVLFCGLASDYKNSSQYRKIRKQAQECNDTNTDAVMEIKNYNLTVSELERGIR